MAEPEVSVVVPTRNRREMLDALLRSLGEQSLAPSRWEVIVVDDGSEDGTGELLAAAAESSPYRLRVVTGTGGGPSAARNLGWRSSTAPLIAFTDDDCVATSSWLEELVESANGDRGAFVQGRTELAPGDEEKVGPYSRVLQVLEPGPYYATCNILYPRELLDRLGGFDEELHTGEDTDLGWRAQEAGAAYRFAAGAIVNHAVVELGAVGKLRWVFRWSDAMSNLRSHPQLRSTLHWGLFWKRSHGLLLLALAGALFSARFRPAALLALPYLRSLRARCLVEGYSPAHAPYLALFDLAEMLAAARGGARYRVPVL